MGVSPHLLRAYELARPEHPHPNPRVGAVVVSADGAIIGEGAHVGPGQPHAETIALDQAGDARGSTVYVSLEPCSHHGLTPPCVDRLIAEEVVVVVVGALDPDPRVAGSGVERLRSAGIVVEVLDDPAARDLDPAYFHHRETGRPLVTYKYAMTLDGAVAAVDGTSQWITKETARSDAHLLRARVDAIVIGSGTLTNDDPGLDVRLPGYEGHQPRPVIVAGSGELPAHARLWERDPLVLSTSERHVPGGEVVVVVGDTRPDPVAACAALATAGYLDILVEGGPTLAGAWWRAGMIDRGVAYVGGKVGGGAGMTPLDGVFSTIDSAGNALITGVRQLGPDVRIDFEIER